MEEQIKDLPCRVDNICDDNNVSDILNINSLINAASDSEQFYFSKSDVDSIINCFYINVLTRADM